jgi:hypothetical protein
MAFDRKAHYVVLFLCISAALCLGQKRRKEPAWLLLFAWAAVQGFHMERDIWVLTVISLVTVAMWLSERKPSPDKTPPTVWLAAAACILAILIYSFKTGPSNRELLARAASQLPVGAVAFIHEHHLQGPIFNHFDWGGFLIYTLPEFPVSIDGRTNVHDQDELEHSFDTWDLVGNWHEDPMLVNANLVIGSPAFALSHALRLDPRFELVFNDGVSVVYQKVKPDLHNNPAQ